MHDSDAFRVARGWRLVLCRLEIESIHVVPLSRGRRFACGAFERNEPSQIHVSNSFGHGFAISRHVPEFCGKHFAF